METTKSHNDECTVIYWNMPVGSQFNSREYIEKYRSLPEDDNSWRIPYIKVGQTTWRKSEDKTVYDAIRKMRGGNKTGYPVPFSTVGVIEFPSRIIGEKTDKRIRKLLFDIAMYFDDDAEKNNFCMSENECRHPESEDETYIAPGSEFIYNITKDTIHRTIIVVNDIIKDGASAVKHAVVYSKNPKYLEAMKELWKLIEDTKEVPVTKTVSNISELYKKLGKPVTNYVYERVMSSENDESGDKEKFISLKGKSYIDFSIDETAKSVLILGNTAGLFGQYLCDGENVDIDEENTDIEKHAKNIIALKNLVKNGAKIMIIGKENAVEYYKTVARFIMSCRECAGMNISDVFTFEINNNDNELLERISSDNMPKFDYIIQNPPYTKGNKPIYHNFLMLGMRLLNDNGQMVMISPATWLIDNRRVKLYEDVKRVFDKHVTHVCIEQMCNSFQISIHTPLSIVAIDKSKQYDSFIFNCCGVQSEVHSLNECNFVGSQDVISSILQKCVAYNKPFVTHYSKDGVDTIQNPEQYWYMRSSRMISSYQRMDKSDVHVINGKKYFSSIISACIHRKDRNVYSYETLPLNGKKKSSCCVYAESEEEMTYWRDFVLNNKLPKFINAALCYSGDSTLSHKFLPWVADRHYTDKEINELFGFSDEEIKLIDYTLKKYEWESAWFQRMFTGDTTIKVNQERPWEYA